MQDENLTTPELAPEPIPVAAPVADPPHFAVIDRWFVEYFHGHGARLETELFNLFVKAKEELKTLL